MSSDAENKTRQTTGSGRRRTVVLIGRALGLCVLVIFAALLALQVDVVSTLVGRSALSILSPVGSVWRVKEVRIGGLSRVSVVGLHLPGIPNGETSPGWTIAADSLEFELHLPALLRKVVKLREVDGSGLTVRGVLTPGTGSVETSRSNGGWVVDVDAVRLEDGHLELDRPASDSASANGSWVASTVELRARGLSIGKGITGTLDSLSAHFQVPGEGPEWGRFFASGAVDPHEIRVGSFILESSRSQVDASGTVPLRWPIVQGAQSAGGDTGSRRGQGARPNPGPVPAGSLNLRLRAHPLHLVDVGPFLPSWLPDSLEVVLDVRTEELGDTVVVQGTGSSNVPGRVALETRVTRVGNRIALDGRVSMEELATEAWGLGRRAGRVNAEVALSLEGPTELPSPVGFLTEVTGEGEIDGVWTSTDFPGGVEAVVDLEGIDGGWEMAWGVRGQDIQAEGEARLTVDGALDESVQGRVLVDSARVGRARFSRWALHAEMRENDVTFQSRGSAGGGTVELWGRASLAQKQLLLTDGRVEDVDFAALLGDTLPSRVNLRGSGEVEFSEILQASFSAESWATSYGHLMVDSARAEGTARGRDLSVSTEAWLRDNGALAAGAGVTAGQGGLRVRLDSLQFVGLDLQSLSGTEGAFPATDLNGRAVGQAGTENGVWDGHVTIDLLPSTVQHQVLEEGRIEVEMAARSVGGTANLTLPDGGLAGRYSIDYGGDATRISVPELAFRNLDVASFLGAEEAPGAEATPPASALSGVLGAELRGREARNLTGSIGLFLGPSRFQGTRIDTASLQVEFREGTAGAFLEVLAGSNQLHGTGEADLSSGPVSYQADLSLDLPNTAPYYENLQEPTALFATARMEGQGFSPDSVHGWASMTVDSARYGNLEVDEGGLEATLRGGTLELDTAFVRMSAGFFGASGTFPRLGAGGRIGFTGQVTRADAFTQLVGADLLLAGNATTEGVVEGSMEDLTVSAEAHISALLWNRTRVQDLRLEGKARFRDGRSQPTGSAKLVADRIELPAAPVRHLDVDVVAREGGQIGVEASAEIDDLRDAILSARLERGDRGRSLHLERFDFRADQDQWSLVHPVDLRFEDGIGVDSLLIVAGNQRIQAHGRIPRADSADFRASVEGFNLETVADLLGRPEVKGVLSASMVVHGTGADPRAHVSVTSSLDPPAAEPGELQADLDFGADTLHVRASVEVDDGGRLDLDGYVPVAFSMMADSSRLLSGGPVNMDVRADLLPLAWFDPFLPGLNPSRLRGVLTGSTQVAGTPSDPTLSGDMRVHDASFQLPALGLHLSSAGSLISFENDQVLVDSLWAVSGEGSLSGRLGLDLSWPDPPAVTGTLQARNFQVAGRADLRASVSGSLDVGGTSSSPSVTGRVEVERADIYVGDRMATPDAAPVTLTDEDYRELAMVFGYRKASRVGGSLTVWDSTALDLQVRLNRDLWIRQSANPEMAVQFTGDLSVSKAPGDSLQLLGTVEGVPGRSYVKQFGRRFALSEGTVTFRGPLRATMVDLTADYEVPSRNNPDDPEATISLQLEGTPTDLGLELSSAPTMEASDMVSYLVAGRPSAELLDGGGSGGETDLVSTGGALALARVGSAVEAYAREQVGLDVVEITTDGLEGVTLLAGRYVSPDLYLGVRQPLSMAGPVDQASEGNRNPELEVELEAVRWLLLNLRAGGRSGLEIFIRSRISYD